MLYYYISGADNILTQLNPVELVDKGQHEFGQYIIKQWEMNSDFNPYTHKRVVKVTMVLSRKIITQTIGNFVKIYSCRNFLSIFMVVYLPTILMNMINQATNYIPTDDKYELIYTINMYVVVQL